MGIVGSACKLAVSWARAPAPICAVLSKVTPHKVVGRGRACAPAEGEGRPLPRAMMTATIVMPRVLAEVAVPGASKGMGRTSH